MAKPPDNPIFQTVFRSIKIDFPWNVDVSEEDISAILTYISEVRRRRGDAPNGPLLVKRVYPDLEFLVGGAHG